MTTTYSFLPIIPLRFERIRAGAAVTGLAVTVSVVNALTGATLLASTTVPEVVSGSGNYLYNWTHGLTADTYCVVTFVVGGAKYPTDIFITMDSSAKGV